MILKFSKSNVEDILKEYYKETENFSGEVKMSCQKESVGLHEHLCAVVRTKLIGSVSIKGMQIPMERIITEEEVKEVLTYMLGKEGIEVDSISYDSHLVSQAIGYGICEETVINSLFNGINITTRDKGQKLKKCMNI